MWGVSIPGRRPSGLHWGRAADPDRRGRCEGHMGGRRFRNPGACGRRPRFLARATRGVGDAGQRAEGENLVFDVLSWRFCVILRQPPHWRKRLPDVRAQLASAGSPIVWGLLLGAQLRRMLRATAWGAMSPVHVAGGAAASQGQTQWKEWDMQSQRPRAARSGKDGWQLDQVRVRGAET